jgi:hypothetical protein
MHARLRAGWPRAVAVGLISVVLLAGCGSPSQGRAGTSTSRIMLAAAHARSRVATASGTLVRTLTDEHVAGDRRTRGSYVRCSSTSGLAFSGEVAVRPPRQASLETFERQIAAALHAAGWQVRVVNVSRLHLIVPVTHPIDRIAKGGLHGAANILRDPATGAQALIFINSPCFAAGRLAVRLERPGS